MQPFNEEEFINTPVAETVEVHPVFPWLTAERRAWLYRVMTALAVVLSFYGIVAEAAVVAWVGLGAALVGSGTATLHTPAKRTR